MQLNDYKEGIKLYNSQNTSAEQLKDNFVIRLYEYKKLWNALKKADMKNPEQHYIVQGVRGAGKTTLLSRLALAVEEDEALSNWLVPVVFKEEEFGITSLFTLWERVAEELDESDKQAFTGLLDDIDALEETDPKQAINILDGYLNKASKKIILFIDNLVELFENFSKKDTETLREVLITNNNIRLIGGSAISLEAFYDHKAPFYQFFNVITLKGLKKKDTITLMQKLSEHGGPEEQQKLNFLLEQEPGKIESIRRLTGGIPRTLVILYNTLMDGPKGSTFQVLEETIDQTTPLYKHRMEDLAKQQRPIVNAIALHWDALSAKEIAEKTRISSKQVSAQLSQLEKQWIIEKIPTNTKNNLYALKERFFNIWYLMRYGRRRDKKKVIWLTRFFEIWCSGDELKQRSQSFIKQLDDSAHPKAALTFANALMCSEYLDHGDKRQLFDGMTAFLRKSGNERLERELLEVEGEAEKQNEEMIEINELLNQWQKTPDNFSENSIDRLIYLLEKNNEYIALAIALIARNDEQSLNKAESLLKSHMKEDEPLTSKYLGLLYTKKRDLMQSEFWYLRAIELNMEGCNQLIADVYYAMKKYELAENYARYAIKANEDFSYTTLAFALLQQNKTEDALELSLQAIEEQPNNPHFYSMIARIHAQKGNPTQSESYLHKALEIDTEHQDSLSGLGLLYYEQKKYLKATVYFEKLIAAGEYTYFTNLINIYIKMVDLKSLEETVARAEKMDFSEVFSNVALKCFSDHIFKEQALVCSTKAQKVRPDSLELAAHILVLLWNNKFEAATTCMNQLLTEHTDELENYEGAFAEMFTLFLAKGQTNLVDGWLKQYQLTERLKPLYYALMSLMRDKYPNEILRMGAELKETVDEILQRIEQWGEDYK